MYYDARALEPVGNVDQTDNSLTPVEYNVAFQDVLAFHSSGSPWSTINYATTGQASSLNDQSHMTGGAVYLVSQRFRVRPNVTAGTRMDVAYLYVQDIANTAGSILVTASTGYAFDHRDSRHATAQLPVVSNKTIGLFGHLPGDLGIGS